MQSMENELRDEKIKNQYKIDYVPLWKIFKNMLILAKKQIGSRLAELFDETFKIICQISG